VQAGWLRDVDQVFAAFLAREVPDAHPLLLLRGRAWPATSSGAATPAWTCRPP
jgi:hypothetical protein